mmetsp:Transcript_2933/g.11878  ORF Transcript_2933/g.11878 Transcript_2933/m.11878 type:complete len:807 (-) Transcript_2933:44-2464(-)
MQSRGSLALILAWVALQIQSCSPFSSPAVRASRVSGLARSVATSPEDLLADGGSGRLRRARQRLEDILETELILTGQKAASPDIIRSLEFQVAEPEVAYDPYAAEEKLYQQPLRWLFRNVELLVPLTWFFANIAADLATGKEEARRPERATQLLNILSGFGPAIIKAGQALASRPDLLPSLYLKELQKLQDQVPPFPEAVAFEQFKRETGKDFQEVFELVEPRPVAAASIGQVYKARLRANGALVAVKIQRPNCEDIIKLDLFILRWYAGVVTNALKALDRDIDLVGVIDDFGELIFREIDYRAEASNAARFAELYAGLPDVFVPRVYPDYTTSKVLTMEWVEGTRLVDKEKLAAQGIDSDPLIETLVQCSLRQILDTGFFHADPHAGNLLATPDGKLCYLDFGMVSYAERFQRYSIIEAVVHLVNRDFEALALLYRRMGFIPEDIDASPIVVALENVLPDVLGASVGELNFKNVINKLGDVMYRFPFSLPPFYIAIIRCLGVLEGVAIQVDPEFRIINRAYPYISGKLLSDPTPQLQGALRQLIIVDGKGGEPQLNWSRLDQLIGTAEDGSDYDVIQAADLLVDYAFSKDGATLLNLLEPQIVDTLDVLGVSTLEKGPSALTTGLGNGRSPVLQAVSDVREAVARRVQEGPGFFPRPPAPGQKAPEGDSTKDGRGSPSYTRVTPGMSANSAASFPNLASETLTRSLGQSLSIAVLDSAIESLERVSDAKVHKNDPVLQYIKDPEATAITVRILRKVVTSPGVKQEGLIGVARKVLDRPEAQEMASRIVTTLGERTISRTLRTLVR